MKLRDNVCGFADVGTNAKLSKHDGENVRLLSA